MVNFCVACLSKDRELKTVEQTGNYDILRHLLCNTNVASMLSERLSMCWECTAQLTNVRKFQKKAFASLQLLKRCNNLQFQKQSSLSSLVITQMDYIEIEMEDQFPLVTIKTEQDESVKDEESEREEEEFFEIKELKIESTIIPSSTPETEEQPHAKMETAESDASSNPNWVIEELTDEQLFSLLKEERCDGEFLHKPFRCESCIVSFWIEEELGAHNNQFHSPLSGEHICDICQCRFELEEKLRAHRSTHYVRYNCCQCDYKTQSLNRMRSHDGGMHNLNGYQCNVCQLFFPTYTKKRSHFILEHKTDFKCGCGQMFDTKAKYQKHQNEHRKSGGPFECAQCGMLFPEVAQLKAHVRGTHATREEVYCEECDQLFKDMASYRIHVSTNRKHISGVVKKRRKPVGTVPCAECSEIFKSLRSLRHHVNNTHVKKEEVHCDVCNKTFKDPWSYKIHMSTNRNHIPPELLIYQCNDCDMKFASERSLGVHVKSAHLKYRGRLRCDRCEKTFCNRSGLSRHVAEIHERVYKRPRNDICEQCGRAFPSAQILRSHMRTHTGEKPYQCDLCPFRTAHSGALYTHNKLVHEKAKRVQAKNMKDNLDGPVLQS